MRGFHTCYTTPHHTTPHYILHTCIHAYIHANSVVTGQDGALVLYEVVIQSSNSSNSGGSRSSGSSDNDTDITLQSYRANMLPFPGKLSHCRTSVESHRFRLLSMRFLASVVVFDGCVVVALCVCVCATYLSWLEDPNPSKTSGLRISPSAKSGCEGVVASWGSFAASSRSSASSSSVRCSPICSSSVCPS